MSRADREPLARTTRPPRDPHNPFDERAIRTAMWGALLYCLATGLGVGVCLQRPATGALAGGAFGVVVGLWLIPPLMRDWQD